MNRKALMEHTEAVRVIWARYHDEYNKAWSDFGARAAKCVSARDAAQDELKVDLDLAKVRLEERLRLADESLNEVEEG